MKTSKVSIIIPAFNEEHTIADIVKRVRRYFPEAEIIVINDGSEDNTARIAQDSGAIVFNHPYNIGNGAAIKSGIRTATGEVLVFMDGDGQHDPADIDAMLAYFPITIWSSAPVQAVVRPLLAAPLAIDYTIGLHLM